MLGQLEAFQRKRGNAAANLENFNTRAGINKAM